MRWKYRILPVLADVIPATIIACRDILFNTRKCCPYCGGPVTDYDIRKKQFAVVNQGDTKYTVMVRVKRFQCRQCHRVSYADQPFYPGTRAGSPVVDLSIAFASMMPYARASEYLLRVGIVIDRWSVRNYAQQKIPVAMTEVYGTKLPASLVSLTALAAERREGQTLDPFDVLTACGHPSVHDSIQPPLAAGDDRPVLEKDRVYQGSILILGIVLLDAEAVLLSSLSSGSTALMDLAVAV